VSWVNLALGVVLAGLLLSEVIRALSPATPPAQGEVTLSAPTVREPTAARRSRRVEARLRLEEAERARRERAREAARSGVILRDEDGQPVRD